MVRFKIKFITVVLCLSPLYMIAQEDLLQELNKEADKKKELTQATFKGTRIVNSHSL